MNFNRDDGGLTPIPEDGTMKKSQVLIKKPQKLVSVLINHQAKDGKIKSFKAKFDADKNIQLIH